VAKSIESRMGDRIRRKGRGWCFTSADFLDLGSREAVRISLFRLVKKGVIRRLARALYDYPRQHAKLGDLPPSPEAVAQALCSRDSTKLQASGAYAANLLGLSEQVPAKVVFLTDGVARSVKLARREIILKSTTPRNMATAGRASGTVIQALRFIGKRHVNEGHVRHLAAVLPAADRAQLERDRVYAPGWMHPILDAIAGGGHARICQIAVV
jgi:hypothetical protein